MICEVKENEKEIGVNWGIVFTICNDFCFIGLNKKNSINKEIGIAGKEDADGAELNWENEGSEKVETNRKFDNTKAKERESMVSAKAYKRVS